MDEGCRRNISDLERIVLKEAKEWLCAADRTRSGTWLATCSTGFFFVIY